MPNCSTGSLPCWRSHFQHFNNNYSDQALQHSFHRAQTFMSDTMEYMEDSATFFLSGVGMTVPSFIEMYVSLLKLGLEQVDWGERSRSGRLSAWPPLDDAGDAILGRQDNRHRTFTFWVIVNLLLSSPVSSNVHQLNRNIKFLQDWTTE